MNTKKRESKRHFPYQHPTFGTKNRPKPESAWKKSVYYWWWAYLKRNDEYLACCAKGGKGKLAKTYADFGDVRGNDFKAWWTNEKRGERLFAEPSAEDSVRVLQAGEMASGDAGTLVLSFPLSLPKKYLEKRFKEILATQNKRGQGKQLARESKALYKINGQPKIEAIKATLGIYDYRLANPQMKLWDIGNSSPHISKILKIEAGDSVPTVRDKKIVLASTVSRYIRKAKSYIKATGNGFFLSAK